MNNYDVLQPLEEKLTIGGEEVTVKTYKAGQISFVLPRIRKLFDAMSGTSSSEDNKDDEINWLRTAVASMFTQLEAIFGHEESFELMAAAINKPVEFVKDASIDEAQQLFNAVFKVNFTYFFKLALPDTINKGLANLDQAEKVEVLKRLMK